MKLTSFIVMDILEKAKEMERNGISVIHLEVGEPDFPVPQKVLERAKEALEEGFNKYSQSMGIPELREAISEFYFKTYNVKIEPERIFVTPGSSPALLAAVKMFSEKYGPKVAFTDPGYPCYKNMARFLGLEEVPISVHPENGFKPDFSSLSGFNVFIANSPSNPTGVVLEESDLKNLADAARRSNFGIISDEIYHGITYEVSAPSILNFTDEAIVINGFSKFFAATGWRLGWIIVPKELVRGMQCIAQNLFICAPTPLQHAAVYFFEDDVIEICKGFVREYKKRRDFLVPALKDLGFGISYMPQGAFYVFCDISRFSDNSFDFALKALSEAHVAITPGIDFGANRTNKFVRFSYANSLENINKAIERLKNWLRKK